MFSIVHLSLFIFAFWCHVLSVHPYSCDPTFMIDTLHLGKTADGSLLLKNAAPSAFRIGFRITWKLVNLLSWHTTNLLDAIFHIETGVGYMDNIFYCRICHSLWWEWCVISHSTFSITYQSMCPLQVCTAVTGQKLPTARWLAGESFAPWAQSMRSWRVWSTSVAPSLSLRNPCGSAFWAAPTLLPHPKRRPPILRRWTVPSCTAAPRLTPHFAGIAQWKPVHLCIYSEA